MSCRNLLASFKRRDLVRLFLLFFLIILSLSSMIVYRKVSVIKKNIMDGTYLFNDTQYRSSLVGALLDCWTYDGIMMNDCTLMNIKTRTLVSKENQNSSL